MSVRRNGFPGLLIRISLLMGVAVAVLLPAGLWLERVLSDRLIASRVSDMRARLAVGMSSVTRKVVLADARVARLASLIEDAAANVNAFDRLDFDRITQRSADGVLRVTDSIDGNTNATVWVPRNPPITDAVKALLARSYAIVNQFGSGAVGETADDVWFATNDGAEVMFAPGDPNYANKPTPANYSVTRWINPVRPANNPDGGPKWMSAQRSPVPPIWYGSVVAPVMRHGALIGATGLELDIAKLLSDLQWLRVDDTNALMVIDNDMDGLIAHGSGPDFARAVTDSLSIASLRHPLRDSLAALVHRASSAAPGQVLSGTVDTRTMLAYRLVRPHWTVITVLERAAIVAPLRGPLQLTRVGLIGVLALLLAAILSAAASSIRSQRVVDDMRGAASERFNRLFQMLPVAVTLTRYDTGKLVELNDAASRLIGVPRNDLVGSATMSVGLWTNPDERELIRQMILDQGFVSDFASTFTDVGGTTIDVRLAARRVDIDTVPHVLTVVQDLSAQRHLEGQLVQAQKLEAVGRLAGGVAHDFNNLLTAVMSYGELLKASFEVADDRRSDVDEILNAGRRGAQLTKQLLGFARRQSTVPRVVNVNEVIDGLARMLKPLIGTDVEVVTDLDSALGTVRIDPGQIEQVITNLVLNARDAMPEGGTLTIRTIDGHRSIALTVTDTGSGISAKDRVRIFEPFFTTKSMDKGTGLGLATCYGIVNQAGGTIECESARGRGTTFRVTLPRLSEPAHVPAPYRDPVVVPHVGAPQRIMVVEDDEMVRDITKSVLESGGYQVVSVEGPSLALAHLLETQEPIDLVISDIVMPRISGPAFGRVLATTHPDMQILFMSGYTGDELIRHDLSSLGHPFLAKPFTPNDLLRAVAGALNQPKPAAALTD